MKSVNQLHLSPVTNMQALTAKARRAAALSIVERKLEKARQSEERKRAKKLRRPTDIELAARLILTDVATHAGKGTTLYKEMPGRYSSAHTIISLYSNAEIEAHRIASERRKTDPTVKVPRLRPVIRYVLYPSVLEPTQLGSVAIYCENVRTLHATIAEAGHLFGIPVKRTALETGMSQYVDVVLRA